VQLYFDEGFLETQMIVEAVRPAANVGTDDAQLADFQVVQAEFGSDSNAPVHGLKGGIPVK
jgi:hypothetical protein